MDRIVQVGDVFVGDITDRVLTVTKVTAEEATMKWECHEWKYPLTPRGTLVERDRYKFVASAPTPAVPAADDLMPGDRVRLKYNKNAGTVAAKYAGGGYLIQWDHRPDRRTERREDLVVLYAPRAADAPFPAQKAIDEVDALREEIKAKVADLQLQLRALNGVKNKLKGIEA